MQFLQSCPIYVQHDEFWHVFVLWPKSFRGPSFRSQLVRYAMKTGLVWLCLRGGFQYAHLIELCWTSHSLEHPSIDLQSQSQFLSCYLNLPNQNSANVGLINPICLNHSRSHATLMQHMQFQRETQFRSTYIHIEIIWNTHMYVYIYICIHTKMIKLFFLRFFSSPMSRITRSGPVDFPPCRTSPSKKTSSPTTVRPVPSNTKKSGMYSYGHLLVVNTLNTIYRMYNPISNQL